MYLGIVKLHTTLKYESAGSCISFDFPLPLKAITFTRYYITQLFYFMYSRPTFMEHLNIFETRRRLMPMSSLQPTPAYVEV